MTKTVVDNCWKTLAVVQLLMGRNEAVGGFHGSALAGGFGSLTTEGLLKEEQHEEEEVEEERFWSSHSGLRIAVICLSSGLFYSCSISSKDTAASPSSSHFFSFAVSAEENIFRSSRRAVTDTDQLQPSCWRILFMHSFMYVLMFCALSSGKYSHLISFKIKPFLLKPWTVLY